MRIKVRLLLLAGLLVSDGNALAQDTNFFIFLCFGQSNMEGFPGIEQQDKTPVDDRFQVLAAVDFPKPGQNKGQLVSCCPSVVSRPPPVFVLPTILAEPWWPTFQPTSE